MDEIFGLAVTNIPREYLFFWSFSLIIIHVVEILILADSNSPGRYCPDLRTVHRTRRLN
ncbi:MAG: hypothetical protein R6U96_17755 [Promethearchaeia archaeon]